MGVPSTAAVTNIPKMDDTKNSCASTDGAFTCTLGLGLKPKSSTVCDKNANSANTPKYK
jgi:hypothetical protein